MGRHIPDEVLEQIRARADIVDLISSYVPGLKKFGASWKACCPFHQEKTPSFIVNPARQTFHCFGCQKGGNVFSFVMELEKLDFPNAVELLARKYNVVIPDPEPYYGRSGKPVGEPVNYSVRERMFLLHEKIASWYAKQLHDYPESPVAKYLETRHIPLEFINRFQIGASPDSWDAAMSWAKREKFTDDEIRRSGIVTESKNESGKYYDRFRNRLMFPIWNEQGRVVAFSARTIEKDAHGAKYVNSPESPVFKKSRVLYALHFARTAIHDKGYAILCEGQLDTIAMHRAGCTNAVAPQGVAFGDEQAAILKRYTDTVYLASDNDKAGSEAVFKDASILLPLGLTLKVVRYQNAKDADEVLSTQGPEALAAAVKSALDFFEFAFQQAAEVRDLAVPSGKIAVAAAVISHILLIDNEVTRAVYLDWLAGKLSVSAESMQAECERQLEIRREAKAKQEYFLRQRSDVSAAIQEQDKRLQAEQRTDSAEPAVPRSQRSPRLHQAMQDLLRIILRDRASAEYAEGVILPEMLDNTPLSTAIGMVMGTKYDGEFDQAASNILAYFQQNSIACPPEIADRLTAVTDDADPHPDITQKEFEDAVKWIQFSYYDDECRRLEAECARIQPGPEYDAVMRQFIEISAKKMALSKRKKKRV